VQNQRIYCFDSFELDVGNRRLQRDGKPLPLSAKAFGLLQTLLENRGRLVEKDELFKAVWRDQIVEESNLTVHISQIRRALGENKNNPRYIETVPGYGYRFVGEVSSFEEDDLVIETESFSRITIENEALSEAEANGTRIRESDVERVALSATAGAEKARSRYTAAGIGLAVLICVSLAFGFFYLNGKKPVEPFEKIKLTRLTNSGKVSRATISPDGKYIAYALSESEGNSIWVQQVGTASNVLVLPPVKAQIWELKFLPDGSRIHYSLFANDKTDPQHFRVSPLGGLAERLPNIRTAFITFEPNGDRIAYAQSDSAAGQNHLIIADINGNNKHTVASKPYPNSFETDAPVVAWSPDRETIACLVNHFDAEASYSTIVGFNVRDGSEKPLSEQRWYDVFGLAWLNDGSGLLISASDKISGGNQIRFLSYPRGEARQITNDLGQYNSVSATNDGRSLVSIETSVSSGIFVGEPEADESEFREVLSETDALHPLVWAPDGRIVYRSNKDGGANLWTMNADGSDRRQLTTNAQVDSRGLCISPDGRYLVFGSWRNGKSNIWRVDADGGNLTQLTNGEVDAFPSCSPNSRSVIYQQGLNTKPTLWQVPIEGGEPVQLSDFRAKWPAISNDGRRVSYFHMDEEKWRFGIMSSEGGPMLQRLDVPASLDQSQTYWSADDSSLLYVSTIGNAGNIWSLPLDGSSPKPVTNFKSHLIDNFSLSRDGKRLVVSRTLSTSDAVLIHRVE
jgi:DNA-binding winged helix-turn-helix (wHTH) protein/Tol biopolymer transport system component